MRKIVSSVDSGLKTRRELWAAIIPAAGRGSRLGFNGPKILYPILGRTMLEWLYDVLNPLVSQIVVVAAPHHRLQVEEAVTRLLSKRAVAGRGSIVVCEQSEPRGMADAVLCAESRVTKLNALVIWGDQVTVQSPTLQACQALHEARPNAQLTLPTVMRPEPYIHIERGSDDRIVRVLQSREGEVQVLRGENDCGVFCFNSKSLFQTLRNEASVGAKTGEFNLLPLLPKFEAGEGSVATLRLDDLDETVGVNTKEDAARVEAILSSRTKLNRTKHG